MIFIKLEGHNFQYEAKEIVNLFINDELCFVDKIPADSRDIFIQSKLIEYDNQIEIITKAAANGKNNEFRITKPIPENSALMKKKLSKRFIKLSLVKVLTQITGKELPWGILTGVRPTKAAQEQISKGYSDEETIMKLQNDFGVSESKAIIMLEVAKKEREFIKNNDLKQVSIYMDVPFCPDRCLYCSFTSNPIKKYAKKVGKYLEAIKKETQEVGKILDSKGWNIETLYVGGGTPTSLNHEQTEFLFRQLDDTFKLHNLKEITVEAGRPDTIDETKLRILKDFGVTRISINPQTMNPKTLETIGRNHSVQDIKDAYRTARKVGFDNINMDIIIGLPGEDADMMNNTLCEIQELLPESITVHTLSVKRGSKLIDQKNKFIFPNEYEVEQMMELCRRKASEMGMIPYYLYRQKNMVGHQENVGYCIPGKECIYNIKMIEEVQNIIALGPGAVSRVINRETGGILKIFNDKSVEGYIERIDEMIDKKVKAF